MAIIFQEKSPIEFSFARFEFVLSKVFHSKRVDKEATSSKSSSVADLSKLVNALTIQMKISLEI